MIKEEEAGIEAESVEFELIAIFFYYIFVTLFKLGAIKFEYFCNQCNIFFTYIIKLFSILSTSVLLTVFNCKVNK